jgi:ABC-type polysaccharide/polyol phosphate export permease
LQNGCRTIWAWRKLLLGSSLALIVVWSIFGGSTGSWHAEGMFVYLIHESIVAFGLLGMSFISLFYPSNDTGLTMNAAASLL